MEVIKAFTSRPPDNVDRLALRRAAHGLAELSKTGFRPSFGTSTGWVKHNWHASQRGPDRVVPLNHGPHKQLYAHVLSTGWHLKALSLLPMLTGIYLSLVTGSNTRLACAFFRKEARPGNAVASKVAGDLARVAEPGHPAQLVVTSSTTGRNVPI